MKFVIRIGNNLYLSQDADYVNNMTDLNIRIFNVKEKNIAKNIAHNLGGDLVKYTPIKGRQKLPNKRIYYTNYELDNLMVLKKDNKYYTYDMELTKKLRNKSVLKLTMEEVQEVLRNYPDFDITIVQFRNEIENQNKKNILNNSNNNE